MKIRVLSLLALFAHLISGSAVSQEIRTVWARFKPSVIPFDQTDPIIFAAKVTGEPDRVDLELQINPLSNIELRDDGIGPDTDAGDHVYTATLDPGLIFANLSSDDVYRIFIGYLNTRLNGAGIVSRSNIFAEVFTEDLPRLSVQQRAIDVFFTSHVVNIVDSQFFEDFSTTRVVNQFIELFPDEFDFLNIVWGIPHFQNRFHFQVSNDVHGLGLSIFDNSVFYGSSGRLKGISVFPLPGFFDGADTGYQHELGHQWINFLDVPPLNCCTPHWPLSNLASGIMGWSELGGQGLSFPCRLVPEDGGIRLQPRTEPPSYSDLDLYLMGLRPAEEVGPIYVFKEQGLDSFLSIIENCDGSFYDGQLDQLTIGDILAFQGSRFPEASNSPKNFRIGTIVVSDAPLTVEAMSFYSFFARRSEAREELPVHIGFAKEIAKPFFLSTGGAGQLATAVFDRLRFSDIAGLIVPGFEVDTNDPDGPTTLFSIRNTSDIALELTINYYGDRLIPDPLRADHVTVDPQRTLTYNVRDHLDGLDLSEGVARGLVTISEDDSVASLDIQGDYFRVDFGKDFATGERLVRPKEFCFEQEARFVDFGSGSEIRIVLNRPAGMGTPSFHYTVYDEEGNNHLDMPFFTDENLLVLDAADLTENRRFGTLVFDFADSEGGWVSARYSAFGRFSVELNGACRDN